MNSTFLPELRKLKSTPAPYLVIISLLFVFGVVLLASVLDVHNRVLINTNPWNQHLQSGMNLYSLFIISPLIILFISSYTFLEQRANMWKYLYTLPISRGSIFITKATLIVIIIFLVSCLLQLLLLFSGYFLNFFYPEYELIFYSPDYIELMKKGIQITISALGIIGVQYFLSTACKNFILPLSIGILGFISAFILSASNSIISLYLPYAHPMISQETGVFTYSQNEVLITGWFTMTHLYSFLIFLIFIGIGYLYQIKREVGE